MSRVAEIAAGTGSVHTAASVVREAVERAEADQDRLNAFIEIDRSGAVSAAEEIDRHDTSRPLAGVPVALKDIIDHAGHITTAGSAFHRGRPSESATVVRRLEEAGAVIIGRTGLHEFAYGFSSENPWFGPVRNPWDLSLSPGGSSGGSAAAVAAGIVPLAIGTDTGGSVRVPAALCGVVGLKVTHGRIPCTGVFPLAESLDTVGPLGASVGDVAIGYAAMAGLDRRDPWSVDIDEPAAARTSLEGLRVAVPGAWMEAVATSEETRDAFAAFRRSLSDLGAVCVDIDANGLVPDRNLVILSAVEAASVHRPWFSDIDKEYGADVEERLAEAMELTTDEHVAARRWQAGVVQAARAVFRNHDVLLTPTVGHPRKVIGEDDIALDGRPTFYRPVLSGYTALVNQFWCPAIALPLLTAGSPPPSIQFIAPWWEESLLLEIGAALEADGLVGSQVPPAA